MPDRYAEKKSVLPPSYLGFIETNNGWEGDLGEEYGYVVLWEKETIKSAGTLMRWQIISTTDGSHSVPTEVGKCSASTLIPRMTAYS